MRTTRRVQLCPRKATFCDCHHIARVMARSELACASNSGLSKTFRVAVGTRTFYEVALRSFNSFARRKRFQHEVRGRFFAPHVISSNVAPFLLAAGTSHSAHAAREVILAGGDQYASAADAVRHRGSRGTESGRHRREASAKICRTTSRRPLPMRATSRDRCIVPCASIESRIIGCLLTNRCQVEKLFLYGQVFGRFGKLPILGRLVPQIISPIHAGLPQPI
jgi:hypothetical protein